MTEESTVTETETTTVETDVEKQAFLERLAKESTKRKDAEKQAASFQQQLNEMKAQMEERESAGLPELERERKRAEQMEKRAAEAEKKAADADRELSRTRRGSLVTAAAKELNFQDPSDASAFLNLDEIEDDKDAERAVKQLAKRKPHLLKAEEPKLPGKVLAGGRRESADGPAPKDQMSEDAQIVSDQLKQFLASRNR